jgi:salicylate hydroxylase
VPASQSFAVTIAGGGLGGLTTALALRRRGLRATVLEQAPELGEVGAGIQTAPNASRILLGLGLRRRLEAIHTEPQDQVRRRWKDGSIIATLPLGDRVKRQWGAPYWHYHRADLHKVLLDACLDPDGAGPVVEVHTGAQVVDIDLADPTRPVALTTDGRSFPGDVLVGADGIRSAVRDAMGLPDTLTFSGEMAYRALIPGDKIAADPATRFLLDRFHSTIWYGPDLHLVHYFIRGGEYLNVVAIVPNTLDVEKTWTAPATADEMVDAFAGWDDRVAAMLSKAEGDASKCCPIRPRARRRRWRTRPCWPRSWARSPATGSPRRSSGTCPAGPRTPAWSRMLPFRTCASTTCPTAPSRRNAIAGCATSRASPTSPTTGSGAAPP